MARRYTVVTADFQAPEFTLVGVIKDTFISETNPTFNYGAQGNLVVGTFAASNETRILLEIQMPEEEDILGFGSILKVELVLRTTTGNDTITIALVQLDEEWDEGNKTGSAGEASWDDAQPLVAWAKNSGAVDGEEVVVDSVVVSGGSPTWASFDITKVAGLGQRLSLVMYHLPFQAGAVEDNAFHSRQSTPDSVLPIIRITYKSYPPDGFTEEDDKLRIIPNPDNPEQPKLTWGPVTSDDFTQYKIYKDTSPITVVDGFKSAITAWDEPNKKFTISGDHTLAFPAGSTFKITGGNQLDGRYTVVDAQLVTGNTVIETSESFGTGAISSFSNPGGGQVDALTSANHNLSNGDTVTILNTANYDGTYTVTVIGPNVFRFTATWVATETGNFFEHDGDIHHGVKTSIDSALEEFIDAATLVDGTTYYYRLIAEDQDNYEDDALQSATVSFTKPDVTIGTLSPSGAQNVGTEVGVTVTSPQNIKRLFVDWKDDTVTPANDIEVWYEYEIVALSQIASHIYTKHTGGAFVTPDVRVEDENGFWSALQATSNQIKANDVTPTAKLLVSAHKAIEGDDVTLNAAYSQPAASNATITKYEFKRNAGDSWQDNGTNPIFTFSTAAFGTGTITASLRITTSTSLQDTDTTTYDLETGTPTDITPGAVGGLSNYTSIHEIDHGLGQNKDVALPIGSAGVEHEFLLSRRAERLTVHASSDFPGRDADITIIRNAWLNNTYLRLDVRTEMDGFTVRYDFKLDGDVSIGHRFDNKLNWSFPIRVISRTEIADSPLNGAITAFSNPGGGKVQATSANHELLNGMYVLITGTINYNGTYQISTVTTNTFRFVATWVADDGMGLWRKVGEG